jgi:hypothetical protein
MRVRDDARKVLFIIWEAAKKTNNGYVFSVDIGLRCEDRINVCNYLENGGYIQSQIRCQLEMKGYAFCEKSTREDEIT